MNQTTDLLRSQRKLINEAVNDALDVLPYDHVDLMEQQVEKLEDTSDVSIWRSGLTCLLTAQALGVSREQALPAACALALLETAASVVDDIVSADAEPAGLIGEWGMARTLNASDGLFALAHTVLPWLTNAGVSDAEVLAIANLIDAGFLAWCEESSRSAKESSTVPAGDSKALNRCAAQVGARLAGLASQASDLVATYVTSEDTSPTSDTLEAALTEAGLSASAISELTDAARLLKG